MLPSFLNADLDCRVACSVSGLLEAVLLHSEARSGAVSAPLIALAGSGANTLGRLDVFVRELSEVALIIFMCAPLLGPLLMWLCKCMAAVFSEPVTSEWILGFRE